MQEREYVSMRKLWLDYARAFACVLVALGHLVKSFLDAQIIPESGLISCGVDFLYLFHVHIFFFCSGYLFQSRSCVWKTTKEQIRYKWIRCVDFLVPYLVFTVLTYGIKLLLSSDVNAPIEHSLLYILLLEPVGHMWYLYAVALITLIAPPISSKGSLAGLCTIALGLKAVTFLPGVMLVAPVDYLCRNMIWFALGMVWSYTGVQCRGWIPVAAGTALVGLYVLSLWHPQGAAYVMLLTFLGVVASVEGIRALVKHKTQMSGLWKWISRYMLQIYLLHTICAAGIRIILMRLDVTHWAIHLPVGIVFGIGLPILCAMVAEKSRYLNLFFFPSKTILGFKRVTEKNK